MYINIYIYILKKQNILLNINSFLLLAELLSGFTKQNLPFKCRSNCLDFFFFKYLYCIVKKYTRFKEKIVTQKLLKAPNY